MSAPDRCAALEVAISDVMILAPSIIVESALFGVLTLLAAFAIITIVRQGVKTRSRVFMLLAMAIMYMASGVHWSFNLYTFMREMQDPVAWLALPNETVYRWSLVTTVALFFDFWISDMVVMWRAVLVWEWSRWVTVPCIVLAIVPLVLALVDVGSAHATASENSFNPNIYGALALGISLLSNLMATSLIGIKAWGRRKAIQDFLQDTDSPSAVQSALVLLIESGLLYSAVWALFIVSTMLNKGNFRHVAHTISGVVPQLVGLYPSIIIVLVALQKTHCDRNFTYKTSGSGTLRFAGASGRSRTAVVSMGQLEEGDVCGTTTSSSYRSQYATAAHHLADLSETGHGNTLNLRSPNRMKELGDDSASSSVYVDDYSVKLGDSLDSEDDSDFRAG